MCDFGLILRNRVYYTFSSSQILSYVNIFNINKKLLPGFQTEVNILCPIIDKCTREV